MDTALPEEKLREIFDRITRDVTEQSAGIRLERGVHPPKDPYTVHIGFRKGFRSSLSLRADGAVFDRLARAVLQREDITRQDLEDVTKEYFNILCGHIARALYHATKTASRFGVPAFYAGIYSPAGQREQFVLSYSDGTDGCAQLVHYIPDRGDGAGAE